MEEMRQVVHMAGDHPVQARLAGQGGHTCSCGCWYCSATRYQMKHHEPVPLRTRESMREDYQRYLDCGGVPARIGENPHHSITGTPLIEGLAPGGAPLHDMLGETSFLNKIAYEAALQADRAADPSVDAREKAKKANADNLVRVKKELAEAKEQHKNSCARRRSLAGEKAAIPTEPRPERRGRRPPQRAHTGFAAEQESLSGSRRDEDHVFATQEELDEQLAEVDRKIEAETAKMVEIADLRDEKKEELAGLEEEKQKIEEGYVPGRATSALHGGMREAKVYACRYWGGFTLAGNQGRDLLHGAEKIWLGVVHSLCELRGGACEESGRVLRAMHTRGVCIFVGERKVAAMAPVLKRLELWLEGAEALLAVFQLSLCARMLTDEELDRLTAACKEWVRIADALQPSCVTSSYAYPLKRHWIGVHKAKLARELRTLGLLAETAAESGHAGRKRIQRRCAHIRNLIEQDKAIRKIMLVAQQAAHI